MPIIRARLVSSKRYCAFLRRHLIFALNLPAHYVPKLLESTRILFLQRPNVSALLDSWNCSDFGAGQFYIEIEDPGFSHADSSVAWELHILRQHIDSQIRGCAKNPNSINKLISSTTKSASCHH